MLAVALAAAWISGSAAAASSSAEQVRGLDGRSWFTRIYLCTVFAEIMMLYWFGFAGAGAVVRVHVYCVEGLRKSFVFS